jgi:lysyl-tRNA synthetase class 2
MTTASILSTFWGNLEENHEQGVFLVLVGFLGSFAFIRMSTRIIRSESISWWPGNVESESGVHVHHLVFGIVTMMIAGTLAFAADGRTPFTETCALGFGIGVGLTIDEFALWVHLEDVYWAKEGRSSIDATVIAAAAMMLIVLGANPLAIDSGSPAVVITSILATLFVFVMVAFCFLKGRVLHGVVGFFVFPVAIYGASRIGKPSSSWARRRYGARRPKKQAKAEDRFRPDRRTERFKEAFRDIVGGKPSEGLAAVGDEAVAATREAGIEMREGAERLAHAADPTRRGKDEDSES